MSDGRYMRRSNAMSRSHYRGKDGGCEMSDCRYKKISNDDVEKPISGLRWEMVVKVRLRQMIRMLPIRAAYLRLFVWSKFPAHLHESSLTALVRLQEQFLPAFSTSKSYFL